MQSKKIYWIIIVLALLPPAFTWFGQGKKKEEPKKQGESKESQQAGDQEIQQTRALPVLPPLTPYVKPVKPATHYTVAAKVYKPVQKPVPVVHPTAVPVAAPSVDRIRQQISDIIRINEDLKRRNLGQVAEIQRITDQARVHQQILTNLEASPPGEKTDFKSSDVESILKQEKIRMIGDETEKNRQRIDQIKTEGDSKKRQ